MVVGSGITGAFITYDLLSHSSDLDVLVLEARTTCSGATGRNGGHLHPIVHDQPPHIIDFELRNFDYIKNLITEKQIACDLRRVKGVIGFWNETYFNEAKEALQRSRKTAPEYARLVGIVEDAEERRKLKLQPGAVGAIVQSVAASLSPYKLVTWLWEDMIKRYPSRLNFQTTTPVQKISAVAGGHHLVHTHRGTVSAQHLILATNGYTSHLLPAFADLITPTQAQMSALRPPPVASDRLLEYSYGFAGIGLQDRVMSDYLVQNPLETGGHLMFGGGRVYVPNYGVGVSDDDFVDPDAERYLRSLPGLLDFRSAGVDSSKTATAESPHPSGRQEEGLLDIDASWTGCIGYSADLFPWIGAVPPEADVDTAPSTASAISMTTSTNLWLCAGYTGHGMTNASGCARHVARLVLASMFGDGDGDWRSVEERAIKAGDIPAEYVISSARIERLKKAEV